MKYSDERFADIQLLRYRLNGFEQLSLSQKILVYYLSKATLYGRDITFDQFGRYNLRIRKMLEVIYTDLTIPHDTTDFAALETYLKRVWFSNGIYHHYGCEKFKPGFSEQYLHQVLHQVVLPKRVNKADGEDLLQTSACHFYEDVTQQEAEDFYARMKEADKTNPAPLSYGLNSTLVKKGGVVYEEVWSASGKYANAIRHIVYWLKKASEVAENERQQHVIQLLIAYYETGDLKLFNDYCIEWVGEHDGRIDFVNGFIEVYGDPLVMPSGLKTILLLMPASARRR